MKSDISRQTFDPAKHFSRVLLQQGRVTLDADWNEQAAIAAHYLRTLATDLIGPHGGPAANAGFEIQRNPDAAAPPSPATGKPPLDLSGESDLFIGPGRYYVAGLLCENEAPIPVLAQPDYPPPIDEAAAKQFVEAFLTANRVLLYLDVWERSITALEDGSIREVALNGPDTATRAKIVWQVKACRAATLFPLTESGNVTCDTLTDDVWAQCVEQLAPGNRGRLAAQVPPAPRDLDACSVAPESRYRGPENQLYRVEIHQPAGTKTPATFKWSRDNGSVAAAWVGQDEQGRLLVAGVRDTAHGFAAGHWVEITDEGRELRGEPGQLVQVVKVEGDALTLDPEVEVERTDFGPLAKLRRWDQRATAKAPLTDGAVPIVEGQWIPLEDGVQVRFEPATGQDPIVYRTGDYWMIPARVATGTIEWPADLNAKGERIPRSLPPQGITHYLAPLAFLSGESINDLRREFSPLAACQT